MEKKAVPIKYKGAVWHEFFSCPRDKDQVLAEILDEQTRYYKLYYPFLQKKQIMGKVYEELGIPHSFGIINRVKLHKLYLKEMKTGIPLIEKPVNIRNLFKKKPTAVRLKTRNEIIIERTIKPQQKSFREDDNKRISSPFKCRKTVRFTDEIKICGNSSFKINSLPKRVIRAKDLSDVPLGGRTSNPPNDCSNSVEEESTLLQSTSKQCDQLQFLSQFQLTRKQISVYNKLDSTIDLDSTIKQPELLKTTSNSPDEANNPSVANETSYLKFQKDNTLSEIQSNINADSYKPGTSLECLSTSSANVQNNNDVNASIIDSSPHILSQTHSNNHTKSSNENKSSLRTSPTAASPNIKSNNDACVFSHSPSPIPKNNNADLYEVNEHFTSPTVSNINDAEPHLEEKHFMNGSPTPSNISNNNEAESPDRSQNSLKNISFTESSISNNNTNLCKVNKHSSVNFMPKASDIQIDYIGHDISITPPSTPNVRNAEEFSFSDRENSPVHEGDEDMSKKYPESTSSPAFTSGMFSLKNKKNSVFKFKSKNLNKTLNFDKENTEEKTPASNNQQCEILNDLNDNENSSLSSDSDFHIDQADSLEIISEESMDVNLQKRPRIINKQLNLENSEFQPDITIKCLASPVNRKNINISLSHDSDYCEDTQIYTNNDKLISYSTVFMNSQDSTRYNSEEEISEEEIRENVVTDLNLNDERTYTFFSSGSDEESALWPASLYRKQSELPMNSANNKSYVRQPILREDRYSRSRIPKYRSSDASSINSSLESLSDDSAYKNDKTSLEPTNEKPLHSLNQLSEGSLILRLSNIGIKNKSEESNVFEGSCIKKFSDYSKSSSASMIISQDEEIQNKDIQQFPANDIYDFSQEHYEHLNDPTNSFPYIKKEDDSLNNSYGPTVIKTENEDNEEENYFSNNSQISVSFDEVSTAYETDPETGELRMNRYLPRIKKEVPENQSLIDPNQPKFKQSSIKLLDPNFVSEKFGEKNNICHHSKSANSEESKDNQIVISYENELSDLPREVTGFLSSTTKAGNREVNERNEKHPSSHSEDSGIKPTISYRCDSEKSDGKSNNIPNYNKSNELLNDGVTTSLGEKNIKSEEFGDMDERNPSLVTGFMSDSEDNDEIAKRNHSKLSFNESNKSIIKDSSTSSQVNCIKSEGCRNMNLKSESEDNDDESDYNELHNLNTFLSNDLASSRKTNYIKLEGSIDMYEDNGSHTDNYKNLNENKAYNQEKEIHETNERGTQLCIRAGSSFKSSDMDNNKDVDSFLKDDGEIMNYPNQAFNESKRKIKEESFLNCSLSKGDVIKEYKKDTNEDNFEVNITRNIINKSVCLSDKKEKETCRDKYQNKYLCLEKSMNDIIVIEESNSESLSPVISNRKNDKINTESYIHEKAYQSNSQIKVGSERQKNIVPSADSSTSCPVTFDEHTNRDKSDSKSISPITSYSEGMIDFKCRVKDIKSLNINQLGVVTLNRTYPPRSLQEYKQRLINLEKHSKKCGSINSPLGKNILTNKLQSYKFKPSFLSNSIVSNTKAENKDPLLNLDSDVKTTSVSMIGSSESPYNVNQKLEASSKNMIGTSDFHPIRNEQIGERRINLDVNSDSLLKHNHEINKSSVSIIENSDSPPIHKIEFKGRISIKPDNDPLLDHYHQANTSSISMIGHSDSPTHNEETKERINMKAKSSPLLELGHQANTSSISMIGPSDSPTHNEETKERINMKAKSSPLLELGHQANTSSISMIGHSDSPTHNEETKERINMKAKSSPLLELGHQANTSSISMIGHNDSPTHNEETKEIINMNANSSPLLERDHQANIRIIGHSDSPIIFDEENKETRTSMNVKSNSLLIQTDVLNASRISMTDSNDSLEPIVDKVTTNYRNLVGNSSKPTKINKSKSDLHNNDYILERNPQVHNLPRNRDKQLGGARNGPSEHTTQFTINRESEINLSNVSPESCIRGTLLSSSKKDKGKSPFKSFSPENFTSDYSSETSFHSIKENLPQKKKCTAIRKKRALMIKSKPNTPHDLSTSSPDTPNVLLKKPLTLLSESRRRLHLKYENEKSALDKHFSNEFCRMENSSSENPSSNNTQFNETVYQSQINKSHKAIKRNIHDDNFKHVDIKQSHDTHYKVKDNLSSEEALNVSLTSGNKNSKSTTIKYENQTNSVKKVSSDLEKGTSAISNSTCESKISKFLSENKIFDESDKNSFISIQNKTSVLVNNIFSTQESGDSKLGSGERELSQNKLSISPKLSWNKTISMREILSEAKNENPLKESNFEEIVSRHKTSISKQLTSGAHGYLSSEESDVNSQSYTYVNSQPNSREKKVQCFQNNYDNKITKVDDCSILESQELGSKIIENTQSYGSEKTKCLPPPRHHHKKSPDEQGRIPLLEIGNDSRLGSRSDNSKNQISIQSHIVKFNQFNYRQNKSSKVKSINHDENLSYLNKNLDNSYTSKNHTSSRNKNDSYYYFENTDKSISNSSIQSVKDSQLKRPSSPKNTENQTLKTSCSNTLQVNKMENLHSPEKFKENLSSKINSSSEILAGSDFEGQLVDDKIICNSKTELDEPKAKRMKSSVVKFPNKLHKTEAEEVGTLLRRAYFMRD